MGALKEWVVTLKITGRATGVVDAATREEAWEKAKRFEIVDDHLTEWEFDEVIDVEANE